MFNKLIKNTFYLSLSSLYSKIIFFCVIFLLTKFIGPDTYGKYVIALNYISYFGLFTVLGFDIVLTKELSSDLRNAEKLQNSFFTLRFCLSLILFFAAILISFFLNYSNTTIICILILSPIIFFGGNINCGLTEHYALIIRSVEEMKFIAYSNILKSTFTIVLLSFLFYFELYNIYIYCLLLSVIGVINLVYVYRCSQIFINNTFKLNFDFKKITKYFKPISWFGLISLIYGVGGLIDITIIASYLSSSDVTYYSLSFAVIGVLNYIISSYQMSIYPLISKNIKEKKKIKKMFFSYFYILILVIIFNLIFSSILSDLVMFILGNDYKTVADLIKIFVWVLPFKVINSFFNLSFDLNNNYYLKLFSSIIYVISLLTFMMYLLPLYSVVGAVYSVIFANAFTLIYYSFTVLSKKTILHEK